MKEGNQNTYNLPRGEPIRRAMRDIFREQRNAVLASLRAPGHKALTPTEATPLPSRLPSLDDFKLGALAISERMTPLISAVWERAGAAFAPRVGLDPDRWSVVNPHTEPMIAAAALHFCQSTNEATSQKLEDALHQVRVSLIEGVVEEGEALPALTKRINGIFDKLSKHKARAIAQTETSRAVHSAQEQAAYATRGLVTGWRWLASSDACPICLAIAARAPTVRLGEPFAIIGENPTYKTIAMPPAHVHCNCSVTEVLRTDPQPTWHNTLANPHPATEDELDKIAQGENDRLNDIVRTWDPETGEYGLAPLTGSPAPKKPKVPRPKPAAPVKPAAPTFGPSDANVRVAYNEDNASLEKLSHAILGPDATHQDVASVVGATDDASVVISHEPDRNEPRIYATVTSEHYEAVRSMWADEAGDKWLGADSFYVAKEMRGRGIIGPEVFGRMVEQAIRFGFAGIKTTAARGPGENGYYTWARFGYDADLPRLLAERPPSLAKAKRVSDLMATEEGRAWWKANGRQLKMTFDLRPGSLSRRIWDAYLAAKRAKSSRRISRKTTSKRLTRLGRLLVG